MRVGWISRDAAGSETCGGSGAGGDIGGDGGAGEEAGGALSSAYCSNTAWVRSRDSPEAGSDGDPAQQQGAAAAAVEAAAAACISASATWCEWLHVSCPVTPSRKR